MSNYLLCMNYRVYFIFSILMINIIMFNWHDQHDMSNLVIILWALIPLFGLHYVIKRYEYCHDKPLTGIQSYSAWVLFFSWITCICFSVTMPYVINIISDTNSHYISLYILSPVVMLFIAAVTAFSVSLLMIIISNLIH